MSRRKNREQKASASRTELFIDSEPSGGGTFTTPTSVDIEPLYEILGLSAQCERWVRSYKQDQILARDIQQRLQGELHLLQVHFERVKREFERGAYQMHVLQDDAKRCLGHISGNCNEILNIVEENGLEDRYPTETIVDFIDTIENQPPVGQTDFRPYLTLMTLQQVPQAPVEMDYQDPNVPSSYTALQQVCLHPVASLESTLARRL